MRSNTTGRHEMKLNLIAVLLGLAISAPALADTFSASVTDVVAEHVPDYVVFQLSGSPCPGYFVYDSPDPQTNRAVYVMLLEAVVNGGSVSVEHDACFAKSVRGVQVPVETDRNRLFRKAARRIVQMLVMGL